MPSQIPRHLDGGARATEGIEHYGTHLRCIARAIEAATGGRPAMLGSLGAVAPVAFAIRGNAEGVFWFTEGARDRNMAIQKPLTVHDTSPWGPTGTTHAIRRSSRKYAAAYQLGRVGGKMCRTRGLRYDFPHAP